MINFVALTFTDYHLTRLGIADHAETLKQTSKFKDELLSSWITFATAAKKSCVAIVCNLERKVDGMSKPYSTSDIKIMKDLTRMKRLLEKINLFLNNVDATWLLDTSDNKYAFRPLWMTPDLAEMFLWKHAKRWVLMSASFLPIHLEAKRLGIDMIEVDYKCLPSTFSVNRRPIHVEAAASLTSKTWVWVAALYNDGREILPQEPQAFTLLFGTDGAFSATTDCNQMGGTYRLQGDQITFSDMFATKMFCEGSQEQAFTQLLADTQSYHITSSELVFDLKFDSGSVIFR